MIGHLKRTCPALLGALPLIAGSAMADGSPPSGMLAQVGGGGSFMLVDCTRQQHDQRKADCITTQVFVSKEDRPAPDAIEREHAKYVEECRRNGGVPYDAEAEKAAAMSTASDDELAAWITQRMQAEGNVPTKWDMSPQGLTLARKVLRMGDPGFTCEEYADHIIMTSEYMIETSCSISIFPGDPEVYSFDPDSGTWRATLEGGSCGILNQQTFRPHQEYPSLWELERRRIVGDPGATDALGVPCSNYENEPLVVWSWRSSPQAMNCVYINN